MDTAGLVLELLKQKGTITPLEQDILDTYHELSKKPFSRDSAIKKITENNINYPDIFRAIATSPTTVLKPWNTVSDEDVCSNLVSQFESLVKKELGVLKGGQ